MNKFVKIDGIAFNRDLVVTAEDVENYYHKCKICLMDGRSIEVDVPKGICIAILNGRSSDIVRQYMEKQETVSSA